MKRFNMLKSRLNIAPFFVKRKDQVKGITHFLTLGVRTLKGRGKNNLAFLHVGRNSVIPVRKYFMLPNLDVFEDLIWDRFSGFINLLH